MLMAPRAAKAQSVDLDDILTGARRLEPLQAVVVAHRGDVIAQQDYRGSSPDQAANIKSASKSVISALVGIAIERGALTGTDQKIAPLLRDQLPADPDPRLFDITVGHLLSMQAGLGRTSGQYYGQWVAQPNWVRAALARPFADDPGGDMLYSTGSSHLLSAILTRQTGKSTLELARDWLGRLDGFAITAWDRDPQGIYFGGNQMAMSTRSLLAFGELYRNGGRIADGTQIITQHWIDQSWRHRTNSRFTGDEYGYGWFMRDLAGQDVVYAWGYGGQMLYIVPDLELTVAMTSDETKPSARTGYRDQLHGLMADIIDRIEADAG